MVSGKSCISGLSDEVDRVEDEEERSEPEKVGRDDSALGVGFFREWSPGMVVVDVVVVLVVGSVGNSPSVEGDAEWGMIDVSEDVIEKFVFGEAAVSAVVSDDEQAPAVKSCQVPPDELSDNSEAEEKVTVGVEEVDNEPVSGHVVERDEEVFLEAFLGDCISQLIDSEREIIEFFHGDFSRYDSLVVFFCL